MSLMSVLLFTHSCISAFHVPFTLTTADYSHRVQFTVAQFIFVDHLFYNKKILPDLWLLNSVNYADECPLHTEVLAEKPERL